MYLAVVSILGINQDYVPFSLYLEFSVCVGLDFTGFK